ncbi:MAG: MBL fold metallo-hydrolase [Leadbetterella sp.]
MIKPIQQDFQIIDDIKAFSSKDSFKIWWLGQSGFLVKWQNKTILFDPYLSDTLTKKYASTDKPHERVSEIVVRPELLRNIDVVTSSHNHTDHLDADTLNPIFSANPSASFVIPEANRSFIISRLGCEETFPLGMSDGDSLDLDTITIIGLPAAHNTIDRDENGKVKCMSFIVKFGDFTLYHSGDTLWYEGLEDILSSHKIDVAFLPINGNKPERKVSGNMSFQEAADIAKIANIQLTIPHHYDMFAFNTEDPENFRKSAISNGIGHKIMYLGEGFEYRKN